MTYGRISIKIRREYGRKPSTWITAKYGSNTAVYIPYCSAWVISVPVDPVKYKCHLDRIRNIGKALLKDKTQAINQDAAVHIMQVVLHSLNHIDYIEAGKRLINNLADPSNPGKINFDSLTDLIGEMSNKITK